MLTLVILRVCLSVLGLFVRTVAVSVLVAMTLVV